MRPIQLVALAAFLVSCSSPDSTSINMAKMAVQAQLKDPDSAKFGHAYVVPADEKSSQYLDLHRVCGDVAGKNSFGAYDGSVRFVALLGTAQGSSDIKLLSMDIEPQPNNQIFEKVHWQSDCKMHAPS